MDLVKAYHKLLDRIHDDLDERLDNELSLPSSYTHDLEEKKDLIYFIRTMQHWIPTPDYQKILD